MAYIPPRATVHCVSIEWMRRACRVREKNKVNDHQLEIDFLAVAPPFGAALKTMRESSVSRQVVVLTAKSPANFLARGSDAKDELIFAHFLHTYTYTYTYTYIHTYIHTHTHIYIYTHIHTHTHTHIHSYTHPHTNTHTYTHTHTHTHTHIYIYTHTHTHTHTHTPTRTYTGTQGGQRQFGVDGLGAARETHAVPSSSFFPYLPLFLLSTHATCLLCCLCLLGT